MAVARKLNSIKEITDRKESWKIPVRIVDLRAVQIAQTGEIIQMTLMDQKGDKIEAQVKKDDFHKWNTKLKEGTSYVMENFEIQKRGGQYRVSDHNFKLVFHESTIVTPKDIPMIPEYVYSFTNFEDIFSKVSTSDVLVHIIGHFERIVHYQPQSNPLKVVIALKNERAIEINCTLWESFAIKIMSFLEKHEAGPVVLILRNAKIKEENEKYPISIQNSKYNSKVFINDDNIPEIVEYLTRLGAVEITQSYSQMLTNYSSSSQLSNKEKMLQNAEVKCLREIKELSKECCCLTVASIEKYYTANGWCYDACGKCSKKVKESQVPFIHEKCNGRNMKSVIRYKLDINVSQNTEEAKFILWDNACAQLLGESAADLRQKMIDEGEVDPMCFPEAIDDIIGKVLAFKVKVQGNYQTFSVVEISKDEATIQELMDHIPNSDQFEAMSITADFDPTSMNLTPAKRMSPEVDIDEFSLENIPNGQFSATKKLTKKTIKTE